MNIIDRLIDRFVMEVSYGRSVDWYLVKLSSIAYEIEDHCRYGTCDSLELFNMFINNERVLKALEPLSCFKDEVISTINNNPRFKILRKYNKIIESTLTTLICKEAKELEIMPRPATWVIEEKIEKQKKLPRKLLEKVMISKPKWDIEKTITYIVIAVFIIGVFLIIYSLFK